MHTNIETSTHQAKARRLALTIAELLPLLTQHDANLKGAQFLFELINDLKGEVEAAYEAMARLP